MRYPLRLQLLVPFLGTALGAIALTAASGAFLAARQTREAIELRVRDVAQTLARSSFPLTAPVLEQMHGLTGAEYLLTTTDGGLLASSGPRLDVAALPGFAEPHSAPDELRLESVVALGKIDYFVTHVDLPRRGRRTEPTRLYVFYPRASWLAAQRRAAYPPLVIGAVAVLPVTILAMGLARRLERPIAQLREQVRRIAEGDARPVPVPRRDDEVGDLVRAVNRLAEELDASRETLLRTERLATLGQLSGGLVHSLRNAITGARGAIQLHRRRCDSRDRESLEVALRQLTLTEDALRSLLTLGRPQPLQMRRGMPRDWIDAVERLIDPTARHLGVTLVREDAPALEGLAVEADPEQLRHALVNLVMNALEAAGPGGRVRIVSDRPAPDMLRIAVLDTGPGPPGDLERDVFEPFVTSKPEGVGLGLAVARRIVENHRGTIRLDRADGWTRVTVELPIAAEEVDPSVGVM